MEQISERSAIIVGDWIEISFPFDWGLVEQVKTITGRQWNKPNPGVWNVPATPWHFSKVLEVLEPLGFYIDPNIATKADQKATPPKTKYPKGLYPFQRVGVDFLYQSGGRAILSDEMGLGKTITALAFVKVFCSRALVICPASVVYKWGDEIEKWLGERSYQIITKGKDEIDSDRDIIIMSYAMMVSHFDALNSLPFNVVIFDECHYLKSHKSQRGRVAKALIKAGVPKVLLLSGTPFLNHVLELFPLLNMIDPVGFSNFFTYAKRYGGAFMEMGHWVFPKDVVTNRDELAQRLSRVMIRRTKKQVLIDLPDLTRTTVPVEISNMKEYKKAVKDIREWLKSKQKEVMNPQHVLTRLNVLRQAVGEGKIEAAIELAESVLQDDKKVVLFVHHTEVVNKLVEALKPYGIAMIVGKVSQKDRSEANKAFQENPKVRVMIISTAGAEGIDLYAASDIIFVEREWTPAKEEQAEARLHRMGQKNAVNAYYLMAKGTVDEKLDNIIQKKRSVIGSVISQDEIVTEILGDL